MAIVSLYLASVRAVNAAIGQVLFTSLYFNSRHSPWTVRI